MLQQPGSLQLPKTGGRSRFSKALPAIPGVDTSVSEPLPQLSSSTTTTPASATTATITPDRLKYLEDLPPPPPPPHNDCKKTPIQFTPLPPLPTPKPPGAATPTTASPQTPKTPAPGVAKLTTMVISRKPVGSGKQMAPQVPEKNTQRQSGGEPQSPQVQERRDQQQQQEHLPPTQPQHSKRGSQEKAQPERESRPTPQSQPQHQPQSPVQPRTQEPASATAAASAAVHLPVDLPPPQPPSKSSLRMDKELPSQPEELKQETDQSQLDEQQQQRQEQSSYQGLKHSKLPSLEFSQYSLLPHFPQPPSPSESLSSIFSAYTRSSNGSEFGNDLRSSDGVFSVGARESQQTEASRFSSHQSRELPPPPLSKHEEDEEVITPQPTICSFTTTASTVATAILTKPSIDLEDKPLPTQPNADQSDPSSPLPPPPPAKDELPKSTPTQTPTAARPSTPPKPPAKPELASPSPSRPQIWRRRSLKGSRELPNLKLDFSHGSTAATQATAQQSQASTAQLESKPAETPQQASENQKMGSGSSKLRQLKDKLHISRKSEDSSASGSKNGTPVNLPPAYRPPTLEYQKEDVKTPMVDAFVSPVSPATSPELAQEERPISILPLPEQKPIMRKAVPAPTPNLQPTKSLPDLKKQAPATAPTESMPPMPINPPSRRASPAPNSPAHRGRWSEDTTRAGPSRSSSAHPENRRPYDVPRYYSRPEDDPLMVQSPNGRWCYRGRDGTLYPEMKELPEPDTNAMNFPAPPEPTLAEDTVLSMRPLRNTHYECYQKHKHMYNTPNRRHALCCQTCQKEEPGKRWYCHFCYLRLCDSCMNAFNANGRDLRALMNHVGNTATLSLSSNERPGTALGLQMNG